MAVVEAKRDIVTSKDFTIARKGDVGRAPPNERPHGPDNWGKILVFFNKNDHGYWCEPESLHIYRLDKGKTIADYIPKKEVFDLYATAPSMPSSTGRYEYHFGKNLQLCRKARKISQAALGEKMGSYGLPLAQSTICYRENSPQSPGGKFVNAAAKALKVPAFVFFVPLTNCDIFSGAKTYLSAMSSAMCSGR